MRKTSKLFQRRRDESRRGTHECVRHVCRCLTVAVLLSVPWCMQAREEYTRTFDKSLGVQNGQKIWLEHKFGDVVIRAHAQQQVVVHADIRVSARDSEVAKQYAGRVEILVEPGAELSIRTRYPDAQRSFGRRDV